MDIQKTIEFIKPKIMLFAQTRAARFEQVEKIAMKNLYKEIFKEDLNMYCKPCVVKCADKLHHYITNSDATEIVDTSQELKDMKMPQLRELARTMGVKTAVKKVDMIYNIINNVEAKQ